MRTHEAVNLNTAASHLVSLGRRVSIGFKGEGLGLGRKVSIGFKGLGFRVLG